MHRSRKLDSDINRYRRAIMLLRKTEVKRIKMMLLNSLLPSIRYGIFREMRKNFNYV